MTTGVKAASPWPCTMFFSPLAGCSIPCARVTPAVLITIPPIVLAIVIFSHSFLFPVPLYTETRLFAMSSIAYKLSTSVSGCAILDVYASILWHNASNVTDASTLFGIVIIHSGSTIDTLATMALQRRDFLSPLSGLVRTANPFPSEPVPQVVGMSTNGRASSLRRRL